MEPNEDLKFICLNNKNHFDKICQIPNTSKWRPCISLVLSIVKNMMSFDHGLPIGFHEGYASQKYNMSYSHLWLGHIDSNF